MNPHATLNACLNATSAVFLYLGWRAIRGGRKETHARHMKAALAASAAFLVSYVIYHWRDIATPYPHHDWTRPVYFVVLISHIILAAAIIPLVIMTVVRAWKGNFDKHRRIARWTLPLWAYVSVTGVIIYVMLYVL